jgi:hypothetical protein
MKSEQVHFFRIYGNIKYTYTLQVKLEQSNVVTLGIWAYLQITRIIFNEENVCTKSFRGGLSFHPT